MSADPIKEALHMLPYGFYAITSRHAGDYNAMVGNWITQVSFTPRLVAFGIAQKAHSHDLIAEGEAFAINIFKKSQADAIKLYTKSRAKNPHKLADVAYTLTPQLGCPVLPGAAAYVECRLVRLVDVGGDHDIAVGEVVGAEVFDPGEAHETLTLPHVGWSYAG